MRRRLSALLFAAALLGPPPSVALTGDKEQPIHIEADRVDIDDVRRVSVYRGNVRYTQGSMRLDADEVSIYYDEARNFQRMRAEGQPARFRQRPDGQAEDMLGEAVEIEYTVAPERLVLKQQAHIWNQGDEFAGEIITYDIAADHVVARRGAAEENRVQVVIQPRQPPADAAPEADPQRKPD